MPRSDKLSRRARLGVESLEAREVPSTTLTGGVLTVRGTAGHDTIVLQSPTPNQTMVRVNGLLEFNQSVAINRIEIDGQGDSDWVQVRGVRAGVTDGVRVVNGELVDLGDINPLTGLGTTAAIRSAVSVANPERLEVVNNGDPVGHTIAVSATEVTGMAPAPIRYAIGPNGSLNLLAGAGQDRFLVTDTPAGTTSLAGGRGIDSFTVDRTAGPLRVDGQGDRDRINIAPAAKSLNAIRGQVSVTDGTFRDEVTVNDQNTGAAAASLDAYVASLAADRLTRTEVERTAQGVQVGDSDTILLDRVGAVRFNAAARPAPASQVAVTGSNPRTRTTLDAGGALLVTLGSNHRLDPVRGAVTITGGLPGALLALDDGGQTVGHQYFLKAGSVERHALGLVSAADARTANVGDFAGIVAVKGGTDRDQFRVFAPRVAGRIYSLDGNLGPDELFGPAGNNEWNVRGLNRGDLNGTIGFVNVDTLIGQNGDDTFHLADGAALSGHIDGGFVYGTGPATGFDTLDYSAYTTPVTVNLSTGQGTNVAGGVFRIRNVFGGSAADTLTGNTGNNVLLGNGGADVINGGAGGRDLLVGGAGTDFLTTTGTGDTVYIGGDLAAADRNSVPAVRAVMAEWTGPNDYNTRVADLAAGVGPDGGVKLSADVLDPDGATDLYGARAGQDVFFADAFDKFAAASTLPGPGEQVTLV